MDPEALNKALNTLRNWLDAGQYDKVIQGCREILLRSPDNKDALDLLQKAESLKHEAASKGASSFDPLKDLQIEGSPAEKPLSDPLKSTDFSHEEEDDSFELPHSARRGLLALATLIPALLVVGGVGIFYWLKQDLQEKEELEAVKAQGEKEVQENANEVYLDENEERVETLNLMASLIEDYEDEKGAYPSVSQIEDVLMDSGEWENFPYDPKQGEVDRTGKTFGYVYAVYESPDGDENAEYILSALFEDKEGYGYTWSQGSSTKNYEDYRDLDQDFVVLLGSPKSDNPDGK